ncbi:MAG: tRNA (5-methylaminomethyl-2-thiouridine)(34)-methyltransferase MnmD [Bacteroidia bacterium]|nr:tRNA (5-methylaminomethyl-2-thiouridine)(34)-methyltransferase MnmD [Bacteroidia bacterium]
MSKDFFNRKIVTTSDGSSSIYLPDFDEHYHSHHGAMQESKHVFMKMGWDVVVKKKSHVDLLEVGFGTGLNAWLVYDELRKSAKENAVHYTSLELYPVATEDAAQLNFVDADDRSIFLRLHEATWNTSVPINERFTLEKLEVSLQEFQSVRFYDLIFYDAFAPRVQPELWTAEIFQKLFLLLKPSGILVTYCAKGDVRRNMIAAGFSVEKLPGPPGKREMLRAVKSEL